MKAIMILILSIATGLVLAIGVSVITVYLFNEQTNFSQLVIVAFSITNFAILSSLLSDSDKKVK